MRGFGRSWTSVRLPERDLGETILEVAAPMLAGLGAAPTVERTREALALVVLFWNASVRASKRWERRRVADLNRLKRELRGKTIDGSPIFDVLAQRCKPHWLDPRLRPRRTSSPRRAGTRRLICTIALPDGVEAEVLPPTEKRIKIGGVFLDEVLPPGRSLNPKMPVPLATRAHRASRCRACSTPLRPAVQSYAGREDERAHGQRLSGVNRRDRRDDEAGDVDARER